MRRFLWILSLTLVAAQVQAQPAVVYQKIAIAADHPAASEAGLEVHRAGGNVVDVAAAVGFALSVVRPESSGLGGGGFMVIWDAEQGKSIAIDYRERAPAAATADMFLDQEGNLLAELAQAGPKAAAIPHHVAGLCHAVRKYGKLDLKAVLAPAVRLAKNGVPLDEHSTAIRLQTLAKFEKRPEWKEEFEPFYRLYLQNGVPFEAGQIVTSPQAELLEKIAAEGSAGFYDGPAAEAFAREMRRVGGIISEEDLRTARPTEREAITASYDDGMIVTMPPPSSGGVALIESLNILTAFEQRHPELSAALHDGDDLLFRHVLTESMKHAFADRATYLGDPDYAEVPTARLVSPEYAAKLAAKIDIHRTKPLEEYGRTSPTRDGGTTHFSVIDAAGNAVACTETINLGFGSYVVIPETGLLLNNEMDDFAAKPGVPNAFGLVQSEAAAVGPGRRPLSSMTPTIFVRDGKAVLAVGASGGPRIITATMQVFLNAVRFGMPAQAAIDAPRQHHQWLPNELLVEPPLWTSSRAGLEAYGHDVAKEPSLAASQLVLKDEAGLHAASDPRKGGKPAGE
ncbi:MAG: gamma-glutamyltransferase [Planctomycetaceae bacterium]|nr:gamma-glutamyltransferase [Planctomycetaceae bacterium]